MELATPDFCATGRQWVLLLATTLRQRDEAIRQRDEARREAEASRGDNVGRRRSGKRSTVGRVQRRRATRRLKSASSANELGVGRARACEDEEATRRRGNARGAQPQAWPVRSQERQRSRKGGTERETRRRRGRQPGSPSHGRTPREDLPVKVEVIELEECRCPNCGKPYARNGEKVTEFVEVEVRAYKRRCRRPRYRSTCSCAPKREAPPVPRLFANTPYGLSVWNWFLAETYALHRPLRSVPRQLSMLDFEVAPGTLGDSVRRFVPLFASLGDAIAERSG